MEEASPSAIWHPASYQTHLQAIGILHFILQNKKLKLPLEMTVTDRDERVLVDWEVSGEGRCTDAFGTLGKPIGEFQFPFSVVFQGTDGERLVMEVTAEMVHEEIQ